jgi:hypothetical protein
VVVGEAARLADEVGHERVTLAAIAERFGVAVPSLYKHVAGIDDVHRHLAGRAVRELGEALATAAVGKARGDALRAISGISRPLASGMETLMVEGLPGYYLDHFMLFISSNGNMRRRTEFASFSWAGWEGGIMWPRENYMWRDDSSGEQTWKPANIVNWLKHKRVVQWNALKPSGSIEHLSLFRGGEMPSLLDEL